MSAPGPGWHGLRRGPDEPLVPALRRFAVGLAIVYSALFGIGFLVLGPRPVGAVLVAVSLGLLIWLARRGSTGAG